MVTLSKQFFLSLKLAFRNFQNNKLYSSLNIGGLAIVFAILMLLLAYYQQEVNYEAFHQKADRIYRPTYRFTPNSDFTSHFARVPHNYINELVNDIPEIEQLIRFQNQEQKYILLGEQRFKPKHIYSTDAEVFEVFDFSFLKGNPSTALTKPHSIVLTESLAQKYFTSIDVLDKELIITGNYSIEKQVYKITGIIKDLPATTHLPIQALLSFAKETDRRGWAYVYTLLKKGANIASVVQKMPEFIKKHSNATEANQVSYEFQALKDIHLQSHLAREIIPNGQYIYVKIAIGVGLFLWLIALINFTNMSTSLALSRGKEMGIRKILGASKSQLAFFLFIEASAASIIALTIGALLMYYGFPFIKGIFPLHAFPNIQQLYLLMLGIAGLSGLLASMLPSLIIISRQTLNSVKQGKYAPIRGNSSTLNIRRSILCLQFGITIILIASAVAAYQQFNFITNRNLGLDSSQILTIAKVPSIVTEQYQSFKNEIKAQPGIQEVTACMQMPSSAIRDMGEVRIKGQSENAAQVPFMDIQIIDPDFVKMMDLELREGADYTQQTVLKPVPKFNKNNSFSDYISNTPRKYLINETAMKQLGWASPSEAIGKEINWSNSGFSLAYGAITGVIKDFHQESLKNKVDPLILTVEPIWLSNILVKVDTKNLDHTIQELEKTWNTLFPYALEYAFLDDLFNQLYKQDQVQLKLLSILAIIAILLALIGLISLIAYALKTRSKELAIRRVIGANLSDLTLLIGKEYFWILIISSIIGLPVSYLLVREWLQNFAYHTVIAPGIYIGLFALAFVFLVLIILIQVSRATVENPIYSLREE